MQIDEGTALSEVTRIRRPAEDGTGYAAAADHRAFLADPARVAALADRIAGAARLSGIRAVSWDVFDTALLRQRKSEARRFHEMGVAFADRLALQPDAPRISAADALLARAEAARAAYRMAPLLHGNREGTLDSIARIACTLLGCPDRAGSYVSSELAVEAASLTPNPLVAALAERMPDAALLFLSDMYIEGPRIRRLVEDAFPGLAIADVISSADGLGSKRSGGVFANAEERLGLVGAEILHLGDSLVSDFRAPRRAGWHSVYLPLPEAERAARRQCFDTLAADLAGAGLTLARYLSFSI